jgi:hypothetical protein
MRRAPQLATSHELAAGAFTRASGFRRPLALGLLTLALARLRQALWVRIGPRRRSQRTGSRRHHEDPRHDRHHEPTHEHFLRIS